MFVCSAVLGVSGFTESVILTLDSRPDGLENLRNAGARRKVVEEARTLDLPIELQKVGFEVGQQRRNVVGVVGMNKDEP